MSEFEEKEEIYINSGALYTDPLKGIDIRFENIRNNFQSLYNNAIDRGIDENLVWWYPWTVGLMNDYVKLRKDQNVLLQIIEELREELINERQKTL